MQKPSALVKIGQASKILGVSIDTLRRWEKSGKIEAIRTPGGTRLFKIELPQTTTLSTEELLKGVEIEEKVENLPSVEFRDSFPVKKSFATKFLIGSAGILTISLLITSWLTVSYLSNPKDTQRFLKNNVASGILKPFQTIAEGAVAVISPNQAKELGFLPPNQAPPLALSEQIEKQHTVLGTTSASRFLEINSDTQINGSLYVRDNINDINLEGTPSASTITLASGNTTLTVTKNAKLDQDVSTTSSPTFASVNAGTIALSATTNQILNGANKFSLPSTSTTLIGKDTTDTLTNKSISGSTNTLTNIPNSALTNHKVTVTAGTNLTGGGDVELGASITIAAKDSPSFSGVVLLSDGTASAPGLSFTNDTDTGLYRIGTNKIGLITGGSATSGITIDSSGNLGVGTISPTTTLYVSGTATLTGAATLSSTLNVSGNTGLGTATTPASTLGVSGNVGIGSSYISSSTPSNGLAVQGNVGIGITTANSNLTVNGGVSIGSSFNVTAPANGLIVQGNVGIANASPYSRLQLQGTGTGTTPVFLTTDSSGTQRFVVLDNGNVGVGTTSPSQALQVNLNTSNPFVVTSGGNVGIGFSSPNFLLQLNTGTNTTFVNSSGNIGIGATTSSNKLDVWGNARITGTLTLDGTISALGSAVFLAPDGTAVSPSFSFNSDLDTGMFRPGNNALGFTTSGSSKLTITEPGNVGIGVTNPIGALQVNGAGAIGYGSIPTSSLPSNGLAVSGNVGIGTTTANSALEVVGSGAFNDGTAGLPALTFRADTNTGIFRPSSDALGFSTGGTSQMTITAAGNIGIGYSAPTAQLYINPGLFNTAFKVDASNPTVIATDGNVGIGFTSPDRPLQVGGDYNLTASLASLLGSSGTQFSITGTLANGLQQKLAIGLDNNDNFGVMQVGNTSGTAYPLSLNPAGGNVGIGITTANSALTVNGGISIGSSNITAPTNGLFVLGNVGIGFSSPDRNEQNAKDIDITTSNSSLLGANGTQFALTGSSATGTSKKLVLGLDTTDNYGVIQAGNTSGTNYDISLNSAGGNVGVGITTPLGRLDISDSFYTASGELVIRARNSTDTGGRISFITPSSTYDAINVDSYQGRIRFFTEGGGPRVISIDPEASSPLFRLEASGPSLSGTITGFSIINAAGSTDLTLNTVTSGNILLSPAGGGNVGIGVSSPGARLQVNSNGAFWASTTAITAPANGLAVQGNVGIGITTANSTLSVSGSAHIGSIRQGIVAPTDGLFVDGNVGIGATTSDNKLDVWGNARIAGTLTLDGSLTSSGGTFQAADGSASAPSYSFSADTNTGIFRPGTDALGFSTNGSSRLTITSAGNLGIGITNPVGALQVNGTAGIGYGSIPTSSFPSNGLAVSGNVGVGTTTPLQALHVVGQCVAKGTRIRRKRKGSRGKGEEEWEEVPVEDIRPDDEILSLNDATGEFEWHKVEKTMDMGIQEVFRLETEGGKWIETTANHPYLVLSEELANKLIGNDSQNNENRNQTKGYSHLNIPVNNFFISGNNFGSHIKYYTNFLNINAIANAAMPSIISITAGINLGLNFLTTTGRIIAAPNQPADRLIHRSDNVVTNFGSTFNSISQAKWTKVSQLKIGQAIATTDGWEKIVGITNAGRVQTYDLQIAGTHNFVGNDIVAHNTYITGNVGLGVTTPGATLGLVGNATIGFGSTATSPAGPSSGLAVSGNVGVGTTSPLQALHVVGQCVTGDTKLKRRKRKKNGEWADEYEEVEIKDIKEEDQILSLNEKTGKFEPHKVKGLMDMGRQQTYLLVTEFGKHIRTTSEHPYFVRNPRWIEPPILPTRVVGSFEVDLSGHIEDTAVSTIVSIANAGFYANIIITQDVKKKLKKYFKKRGHLKYFGPRVFASAIIKIIKQANLTPGQLKIDLEYPGYLQEIDYILNRFHPDMIVAFGSVGKHSPAHFAAYGASKGKLGTIGFLNEEDIIGIKKDRDSRRNQGAVRGQDELNQSQIARGQLSIAYYKSLDLSSGDWVKVKSLKVGLEVATTDGWERIVSITPIAKEQVYDIEVGNTHNFVGNDIVAHNTYITGNVGLGVTTPGSTLSINGNSVIGYSGVNITGPSSGLAVSGNVGVGTTTANSTLSVSGSAHIGSLRQGIAAPSNGLFVDGNVGIGATTSSNLLDVWGNARITGTLTVDSTLSSSGLFRASNGTATTPAYSFTNLTNAGLWTNGDGLLLTTAGSNTSGITVTGTGNVGIGITNPVQALSIQTSDDPTIRLRDSGANKIVYIGNVDSRIYLGSDQGTTGRKFSIDVSTPDDAMFVDVNGNLGIGITSAPDRLLHIGSTINITSSNAGLLGVGGTQFGISGATTNAAKKLVLGIDTTDNYGVIQAGNTDGTNYNLALNPAGGNVGVGVTTANSTLAIAGNGVFGSGYAGMVAPTNGLLIEGSVGIGISVPSQTFQIGTAGNALVFTSGGNLGVGITTPSQALEVIGTARIRGSVSTTGLVVAANGNVGIGTTAPGAGLQLTTNGLIGYTGNVYGPSSGLAVSGNVGVGTTTPLQALHVVGQCVTGDTLLKKRRRRKLENGKEIDEWEDVRIDQIQPGDEILTLDEHSGEFVVSRVNALMDMGIQDVYELLTASGKLIKTTSNHPYLAVPLGAITQSSIGNNSKSQSQYRQTEIEKRQLIHNYLLTNTILNVQNNKVIRLPHTNLAGSYLSRINGITIDPNETWAMSVQIPENLFNLALTNSIFNILPYQPNIGKWIKVKDLTTGQFIATLADDGQPQFEKVISIKNIGRELTFDIEVENTHNFVGNNIVAHNTYINSGLNIGAAFTGGAAVPSNGLAVSGNVGIGITTANSTLSIAGNAHIGGLAQGISAPANGLFVDGNVGIGATTSSNLLDVWGNTLLGASSTNTLSINSQINTSLTFVKEAARTISVADSTSSNTAGAALSITGAAGSGTAAGGAISITSGAGGGTGLGGNINITVGTTTNTSNTATLALKGSSSTDLDTGGGPINITGGDGRRNTTAGAVSIAGGTGIQGSGTIGGAVNITGGVGTGSAAGGSVYIVGGTGGSAGNVLLGINSSGTATGNVGIGNTTPGATLAITGNAVIGFGGTGGNIAGPANGLAVSGNVGVGTTTANSTLSVSGSAHIGGVRQGISAPANGLFVDGNVGIGATTSNNILDVWGNARIAGTLTLDSNFTLSGGQFLANNGTSALPSYSFTNSTSTGMYSPSTNALALQTNGASTPPLTITAGGNVGIGLTNPVGALQVNGAAGIGYGSLPNSSFPSNGLAVSGNVGVGTTSPTRILELARDLNPAGTNASLLGADGTQLAISGSTFAKKLVLGIDTTDNYGVIQAGNTDGTNYTLSLNPAGGNVGIGFTSPTGILHIGQYGSSTYRNTLVLASDAPRLYYATQGGNANWKIAAQDTVSNALTIAYGTSNATAPSSTYTDVLTINNSGNVGIGITTANSALTVNGGASIGSSNITAPTNGLFVLGNVGIGFTSPDRSLQVSLDTVPTNYTVGSLLGAAGSQFSITGSSASNLTKKLILGLDTTVNLAFIQAGNNAGVGNTSPFALSLNPSGGNVGIGTTNPTARLTVSGNALITNAPTAGTSATASRINTGDPNTKGLIIKAKEFTPNLPSTLVGYWQLDESSWNGTTGEIIDATTNNNNGTTTGGAVTTTSGKFSNAANLDGSNDYLDMGDKATFDLGTNFTISAWVYPTGCSDMVNGCAILGKIGNYGVGRNGYVLVYRNSKVAAMVANTTTFTENTGSGTTLTQNAWNHVAMTYDGANITRYLNGVSQGQTAATLTPTPSGYSFKVGAMNDTAAFFFQGRIDEPKVYNYALSGAEITTLYNLTPTSQVSSLQEWQNNGGLPVAVIDANGNLGIGTSASLTRNALSVFGSVGIGDSGPNGFSNSTAPSLGLAIEGNVGIGTTSPRAPLEVVANPTGGSSQAAALFLNGNVGIGTTATGFNNLQVTGSIGIGTSYNPGTYKLDVAGTVRAVGYFGRCGTGTDATQCNQDVAEIYQSLEDVEPGDLLMISNQGDSDKGKVGKSTKPYQSTIMGIVSTSPGLLLGIDGSNVALGSEASDYPQNADPKLPAVALTGKVPLKVSTENGPIQAGDYLTSSSIPGVAMKAIRAGPTVGKSLQSYNQEDPTIIGRVLTFVSVGYADPGNFLASLSLDADGNLIAPKIKTDKLLISDNIGLGTTDPSSLLSYEFGQTDLVNNTTEAKVDVLASLKNLDSAIATNSAKLAAVQSDIASASAQTSSLAQQLASAAAEIAQTKSKVDSLNLTPPDTLYATGSAQLKTLAVASEATVSGMLTAYQAAIQDNFKVFGTTTLGKTSIAGDLFVDGTLSIENGSELNVIGTLFLQKNLLAEKVNIFNGKVTIDKDGNITSSGEIAGASIITNKLTISNTPIASSSASLTPTIGSAALPANQTKITIPTAQISDTAKVFITPTTLTDKVLSVTNIKSNESFDVSTLTPTPVDINFNWWIVQTE